DAVAMMMERGQFVAWARTGSLEASTEAASPVTKHSAPTTVVTAWRLRAIGGPTTCPFARVLCWVLTGIGIGFGDPAGWFNSSPRAPWPGPQFLFRGSNAALPDGAGRACSARYFQERFLSPPDAP